MKYMYLRYQSSFIRTFLGVAMAGMSIGFIPGPLRVSAADLSADGIPYDHAGLPAITTSATDRATGEKVYMDKGCIECHGPRGYSEDPDMFPRIAGLENQYIIEQLTAFQSGNRQNVIMSPVAATLTADDIMALAAFISAGK